jgi:hypothetical protein
MIPPHSTLLNVACLPRRSREGHEDQPSHEIGNEQDDHRRDVLVEAEPTGSCKASLTAEALAPEDPKERHDRDDEWDSGHEAGSGAHRSPPRSALPNVTWALQATAGAT